MKEPQAQHRPSGSRGFEQCASTQPVGARVAQAVGKSMTMSQLVTANAAPEPVSRHGVHHRRHRLRRRRLSRSQRAEFWLYLAACVICIGALTAYLAVPHLLPDLGQRLRDFLSFLFGP